MALALLCLGLTLLGTLQTQAQDSAPSFIPAPSLDRMRLQPDFRDDKFQGKWYVVGLAGNDLQKEIHSGIKMYSTTYKLETDHSYNVTAMLVSDDGCEPWIVTFVPSSQPGRFNLGNIQDFPHIRSYTAQVIGTNYKGMALMYFVRTSGNREYFRISLLRRTKQLHHVVKERFIHFAKSLGLTDDHIIFPVPNDQCIDD